jgi:predicted nucleic acid-binding protein
VTATGKLSLSPLTVKTALRLLEAFEIVTITPPLVFEAIDCSVLNGISFWDALIVAAAASANCETLWTEDLNPGQTIMGVRIENPLADLTPPAETPDDRANPAGG